MGHPQTWDWKIAGYLFLAGAGSGAFLVAAAGNLGLPLTRTAALLGVCLVGVGAILLIGDLGNKLRFWRVLSNPTSSWISIGSWLIGLFLLSGTLYFFSPNATLAWVGMLAAAGTATYTGILLGVVKARPFWNTPLLPILFLVSALSTGTALITLLAAWMALPTVPWFGQYAWRLIILEGLLVFLYLLVMVQSTAMAARSAREVLWGSLKAWFWGGTVGAGLVLPLTIFVLGFSGAWLVIAAWLVLAGGASLRWWMLRAGARRPLPGEGWEDLLI